MGKNKTCILLEWLSLVTVVVTYHSYLQSTIDLPSDNEALIFGQHRLYERTITHNPNAKLTIVIRSTESRLGNNMFQYASSFGIVQDLSVRNPVNFCMDPAFYLPYLDEAVVGPLIPNCTSKDVDKMLEIPDLKYASYHETKLPPCQREQCNYALKGYYQSWKYFDKHKHTIRQLFQFKPQIQEKAKAYLAESTAPIKIGIHVRKGDMSRKDFYLRDPPLSFYQKAMDYFQDRYGSIQFIVASDDPDWCAAQPIFAKAQILRHHTAPVDMAILSLCHHVIISRGSFGWWAAYLTGSTAVYFKDAFVMEHPENLGKVKLDDHYPPTWVGIGA
jgi:galactoside 2-L-fucosyltransferase 1/2